MRIPGIYKIESAIKPERVYIGSAVDVYKRGRQHSHMLMNNQHRNPKLQNHFNKYGSDDLKFKPLLECDVNNLIRAEQVFINVFEPYFNICTIAGSPLGIKWSEEAKRKMSEVKRKIKKSNSYELDFA